MRSNNPSCSMFTGHTSQPPFHSSLLYFLKALFGPRRPQITAKTLEDIDEQSVLNSHVSSHSGCIFCGASKENGFNVIWEVRMPGNSSCLLIMLTSVFKNDDYTMFTDINPSSAHHLQLIPKRHIGEYMRPFSHCNAD